MWQLELLSWVVPAFGALAKEVIDSGPDAQDCYSDLVNIGLAVSTSRRRTYQQASQSPREPNPQ